MASTSATKRVSLAAVALATLALVFAAPQQKTRATKAAQATPSVAFRVTFGEKRSGVRTYDGSLDAVGGRLIALAPWRFFGTDRITGGNAWKLEIKRGPMENQPDKAVTVAEGAAVPRNLVTAGLIVTVDSSTASVKFTTAAGPFEVLVSQLRLGTPRMFLDGDVVVERVPESTRISTNANEEHDYPALAVTRTGEIWHAWQSYRDAGDHVYVRSPAGTVARLTDTKTDVFRPSIAEDRQGGIHVVWSERDGEEWHLVERLFAHGKWSSRTRIRDAGSPNFYQRLASHPSGALFLVWVGHEAGESYLYTSSFDGRAWSAPLQAAGPSVWRPDAAVDANGTLHLAWDSYQNGNYDVFYRTVGAGGALGKIETVAGSARFEAHASLAIDSQGRPWLAWDESGSNWGKDWSRTDQNRGTTLYTGRAIRAAVRSGDRWMSAGEFSTAVPTHLHRYAQLPRLAADGSGRMWALFQIRTSAESTHDDSWATGGLWDLYLATYEKGEWRRAAFVPDSTARPEAPFELAGARDGVRLAWSGDGRTYTGKQANHEQPTMVRYDVFTASALSAGAPGPVQLQEPVAPTLRPQVIHDREKQDIERIRAYRTKVGGTEYRIVRGDFHRHTEVSYDGAGDGSIEDYYRYMIDAAGMDTGIMGDHNMGGNMEYNWWRTEKSYDLFRIPGRFLPLFGYERSVRFPNGHRNVVFDHRGVRTLPVQRDEQEGKTNSGRYVYPYLRQNRGICMEHSLATNQGTDYRDNDPDLEPLVEIYQGYHANYEYPGAPRAESPGNIVALHGPYQAAGFWWNALARGLKLGVHASSDHISTHCSYAMILTPAADRRSIVENMRRRHAYAATDNIILDFQVEDGSGNRHLMGEAFPATGRPRLRAHIAGTGRIGLVDVIRNNQFIYNVRPGGAVYDLEYTDQSATAGENYYYIRVMQEDGNLAWSSPVWITQR